MTTAIKRSAAVIVISLVASICVAKDWRGIVPLKSTRAEVEQKLGKPTEGSSWSYYYRLPNELAVISFQAEPCDDCGLGWKVPAGTVTSIAIIPRHYSKKPVVSSKFKAVFANAGLTYYANPDEGLTIETFNGGHRSFLRADTGTIPYSLSASRPLCRRIPKDLRRIHDPVVERRKGSPG